MPSLPPYETAVRLSNRQYCQLKEILHSPRGTVGIESLSHYNQLTLGANKRREFVAETPKKDGVQITDEGKRVLQAFESADFYRKVASMRFSSFLGLNIPGAEEDKKKKNSRNRHWKAA